MKKWTIEQMGSQANKTVLMTGGTTGAGLEAAKLLCAQGARVVLCSDDIFQAERALNEIHQYFSGSLVSYEHVDFGDLHSVSDFSDRFVAHYKELHVLINNVDFRHDNGRMLTQQGHELMLTYNYLSQFVLTAKLFSLISQSQEGRIIFQSDLNHSSDQIDLYDLETEFHYRSRKAYGQSKLALLIFARELDRRLRAIKLNVKSIPIHAGGFSKAFLTNLVHLNFNYSKIQAAVPILFAATAQEATSGHYYEPSNTYEIWGMPKERDFATQAKNLQVADQLWTLTEEMTGVEFTLLDLSNIVTFRPVELDTNQIFR